MISANEHETSTGARPVGKELVSNQAAANDVQQMFDSIAPRYDFLNHFLSMGIDRFWWWRAARTLRGVLSKPEANILDLCCGTGDMTLALLKRRPSTVSTAPIIAVDFSHAMLWIGSLKFLQKNILPVEADALHLPAPTSSMDLISSAFGFRNLADYSQGLSELYRVLKPGGQLAILECNQPSGLLGALYSLYFARVLPRIGALFSSSTAYTYLPASVQRFPRPPRMLELIRTAGFRDATWTSYTFGVVGLYRATKP